MGKKSGGSRNRFDARRWENDADTSVAREKRRSTSPSTSAADRATQKSSPSDAGRSTAPLHEATVISITRRLAMVVMEGATLECRLPSRLAAVQQSEIAPGDRVLWVASDDGSRMIQSVLPRSTFLARPDPHNPRKQRVIAANIDTVVNVVAVRNPPLRPRLIDRYLIATMDGGAKPLLCVNKVDLLTESELQEELRVLDVYRGLGIETILCSIPEERGLGELMEKLRGGTSVFVGHSGVGKSSILRLLIDVALGTESAESIRTAPVGEKSSTGKHTTRQAVHYDLGGGTAIIDTPGIREFGLWSLDAETLRSYFPEFDALAHECRFNDCSHIHEPRCAVRLAAEEGRISKERFDTYGRLHEELEQEKS